MLEEFNEYQLNRLCICNHVDNSKLWWLRNLTDKLYQKDKRIQLLIKYLSHKLDHRGKVISDCKLFQVGKHNQEQLGSRMFLVQQSYHTLEQVCLQLQVNNQMEIWNLYLMCKYLLGILNHKMQP